MVRVYINAVDTRLVTQDMLQGALAHQNKLVSNPVAFSHVHAKFYPTNQEITNPLILAVHTSFAYHIPLELSPDVIFNTILQGVGSFISKHKNKKPYKIAHDHPNWEATVLEIKNMLLDDSKNTNAYNVLNTSFTTTSTPSNIAHTCAFMETVRDQCDFVFVTQCGIPFIEITGTKRDWVALSKVLEPFLWDLNLFRFNEEVQSLLLHFIRVFDDEIDIAHWNNIYKFNGPASSGSSIQVSGWIAKFFLYIKNAINPMLEYQPLWSQPKLINEVQIPIADFPSGLTNTPFKWLNHGQTRDMSLVAGLIGITVNEMGAIKPELGWVVSQDNVDIKSTPAKKSIWQALKALVYRTT